MKTLKIVIVIFSFLFLTSCATMIKHRETGNFKKGINIVSDSEFKDSKISINGKDRERTLIYDGSKNESPFYVARYVLPKAFKRLDIIVTNNGIEKKVTVMRKREKGWFWVEGPVYIIVDLATGALFYYDDLNVASLFQSEE